MILRHNDRKHILLMTYHLSLTDLVFLPHIVYYYRLMFSCYFVFKNMSLKKICLSVIVSTKHIIVPLS